MIGKLIKSFLFGLTLAVVSLSPVSVFALGVGGLNLDSSLNKPLEAKIEILGVESNELETLTVNLAAADVYDRMGIERTDVQDQLKFRVDQDEKGAPFIRVYTTDAVNEPFLNFLLEVNWSSGRLLREFTVLLDPPTFDEEQAKPVESPQIEPSPAVMEQEARDFEVAGPDVVVNAPPIEGEKAREVVDYGPIKNGENLWNISSRIKPSDISRQQIMLALFRQNPDAFFRNNPGMLKEGAVLRLDDIDAARRIPVDEAIAEMARHHQDWLAYRRERAASRAIAAESAGGELHGAKAPELPSEAELEATKEPLEPMLKLVTPSSEEAASLGIDSATADRLETDLNSAKIELAMANELLEATRQENKDLNGRINALESQLQKMNSLIELRDKEMQLSQSEISSSEKIKPAASLNTSPDDGSVITEIEEQPEKAKTALDIFKDPLTVGTIVGVIVLLLLFFIVVSRNKNKTNADFAAAAAEEEAIFADSKPANAAANMEVDAADVNDLGFSSTEPVQNPEDFIDPISEADVYIAYGKYDKAEELLKPAIEQNPDRHEIKLKLLEVYSLSENKDEFEERVEELYASLSGDKENPLWLKAVELAESICPNNPLLFSETDSRDSVFLDESAASALDTLAAPERDEDLLPGEDSTQIIEKDIVVEDEIEPSAAQTAKTDEISSIEDKQYDTSVASSEVGMLSLDEAELELTGIGEDAEPSEPAVEQTTKPASDDTMIQSVDGVDSIGISDLELSQLEPGEDLSLSTAARPSEPQVTEHGLTSMLEEFDEPDIGEIETAQEGPVQSIEELTAIAAETEVVSVGYDSQFEVKSDEPLTSTMSEISPSQIEEDALEEVSNIFSEDSVAQKPAADFDDTSMFLLADEVGTKLDLARAYIEMGDKEGAVELLREVEDEGSPKQQADAKGLLELAG